MKAPNGKPTNLNEKQWLQVRTKAFKKWFGDWERLNDIKRFDNVLVELKSEDVAQTSKDFARSAINWIENNPQENAKTVIGEVAITRRSVKDDFSHSKYADKLATLPAVKTILENGVYLGNKNDKDGKPITNYYFAGTVKLDGNEKVVFIRVKKAKNSSARFYVHEVFTTEKRKKVNAFKTTASDKPIEGAPTFYENIIADFLISVNENDVSKIIDENGEPLVVYHGTNEKFNVFDKTKGRANMDIQGMFFSPWETDSQGYGSNVRSFFLNVKNPASFGDGFTALNKHKSEDGAGVSARLDLIKQGFDGVNNDGEEYIAFSPNQIKSATDNTGTFDSENADIRYSLAQIEESSNGKLSLNMDAPRDLFYDPMRQIYDKARHDKFVKDKTNEELEALNTAATNYDSLLKIAQQATTLACWQVRNKRDNAPNWVINRLTKHLNDAERAIAVERAQMTYEIIKNRYGEIPNLSAENATTAITRFFRPPPQWRSHRESNPDQKLRRLLF